MEKNGCWHTPEQGVKQVRKEVLYHKTGDAWLGVGCSSFPALPLWEEVCSLNRPSLSAMATQIQGAGGASCLLVGSTI